MNNREMLSLCQPFAPLWSRIAQWALEDVIASCGRLGVPKATARAGRMHDAQLKHFTRLADYLDPLLVIHEGGENELDFMVLNIGEQPVAVRWSRGPSDSRVSRNDTGRQHQIQCDGFVEEQGRLAFADDDPLDDRGRVRYPIATFTHDIQGDVEVGVPKWWISEVALKRERPGYSEVLKVLARFSEPVEPVDILPGLPPQILERRDEEMEELAKNLRRRLG